MVYIESKSRWYFTLDYKSLDHVIFFPASGSRNILGFHGFYKRGVRLRGIREAGYRYVSGKDPE